MDTNTSSTAPTSCTEMWVWNQNQLTEPRCRRGGQGRDDRDLHGWDHLDDLGRRAGVPRLPGDANYVHKAPPCDFGGVTAKQLKLNILSNWGGLNQAGLSEVRFFHVPVRPFGPTPPSGATGVVLDAVLNWRPGREAVKHEVYVSSDREAVATVTARSRP